MGYFVVCGRCPNLRTNQVGESGHEHLRVYMGVQVGRDHCERWRQLNYSCGQIGVPLNHN
eukprot:6699609-Lingulodinium_polyedra.AAC.1